MPMLTNLHQSLTRLEPAVHSSPTTARSPKASQQKKRFEGPPHASTGETENTHYEPPSTDKTLGQNPRAKPTLGASSFPQASPPRSDPTTTWSYSSPAAADTLSGSKSSLSLSAPRSSGASNWRVGTTEHRRRISVTKGAQKLKSRGCGEPALCWRRSLISLEAATCARTSSHGQVPHPEACTTRTTKTNKNRQGDSVEKYGYYLCEHTLTSCFVWYSGVYSTEAICAPRG